MTEQSDNRVLLEGTVTDTLELRWWLAGFGSQVEVIEPVEIREHFVKEAQRLMEQYQ